MTAVRPDTPFDLLIDEWCAARNNFGLLRRWPGLDEGTEAIEPEELNAAARAFRDACDRLAELPEQTPDCRRTGADLAEKQRLAGALLGEAAAFNEPWLAVLSKRIGDRLPAAHPDEFFPPKEEDEAK